jgi:hypothetical protein
MTQIIRSIQLDPCLFTGSHIVRLSSHLADRNRKLNCHGWIHGKPFVFDSEVQNPPQNTILLMHRSGFQLAAVLDSELCMYPPSRAESLLDVVLDCSRADLVRRIIPNTGLRNFRALMFRICVMLLRNGGFDHFSKNQSAQSLKVTFLLVRTVARFPSSRASSRSRRNRSASSQFSVPLDSLTICPPRSRYRTHRTAVFGRL